MQALGFGRARDLEKKKANLRCGGAASRAFWENNIGNLILKNLPRKINEKS